MARTAARMSLGSSSARGRSRIAGVVQAGGDIESSRWSAWPRHPTRASSPRWRSSQRAGSPAQGMLGEAIAVIDELAAQPRVRAIGETGLDFFRTEGDGLPAQFFSFEAHIALAKHGIAMQIHDRDAHDEVLSRPSHASGAPDRTVFHCFSRRQAMARLAGCSRGYWLSFAGNVTFKNAQNLRDALAVTPLERILVETDAPFLTPTPFRGRPGQRYLVPR
ncbi:MAG: TatD family hydrolase [Microbacterium sp.]